MVRGGFFLRKKPLGDSGSHYTNSAFAIGQIALHAVQPIHQHPVAPRHPCGAWRTAFGPDQQYAGATLPMVHRAGHLLRCQVCVADHSSRCALDHAGRLHACAQRHGKGFRVVGARRRMVRRGGFPAATCKPSLPNATQSRLRLIRQRRQTNQICANRCISTAMGGPPAD